jgi:hypothetical protein
MSWPRKVNRCWRRWRVLRSAMSGCGGREQPGELPCLDELPDDGVDGIAERPAGLVLRDAQQADRVALASLLVFPLVPDDAVQFEAADLIDAAAAEQPYANQGAHHFDRVVVAC